MFIFDLTTFQIFPLLSMIFILSLGFIVLFKNKSAILNKLFFLISIVFGIWQFGTFMMFINFNDQHIIFWDRFIYMGVVFMPALQYHFSLIFTHINKNRKILLYISYLFSLVFLILSRTDYFVANVFKYQWGVHTEAKIFHHFFLVFFFFYIFALLYNFVVQYKKCNNISEKHRLTYLITSFAILNIIGGLGYLPAYNISIYSPIPLLSPLIFSILIAYTIIVHHLMNIDIIIRLGTIYSILFTIISFIFIFFNSLISQFISGSLSFILPSFIITIGFIPLKNLVENTTDKIFFKKSFKHEEFINQFNLVVRRSTLSLDNLLENFNQLIVNYLRVEQAAICLLIPKDGFISRQIIGGQFPLIEFPPNHPITNFFLNNQNRKEIIDKEVIKNNAIYDDIVKELENINFSLVIPMELKGQLIGIYLIGRKKSQDSFTSEEIELLKLLATESSFAIDNARLFENLKTIDDTKSKFISVVSHQLRTPLTSIRWNLELILNKKLGQKIKMELLDNIYKSVIFLTDHLDDMLTVLDIEERKIKLKKENNDFKEIVEESIKQYAFEIKNKNISFILPLFSEIKPFLFDKLKIKKTISIILRNAILYSHPLGKIKINAEIKEINKIPNLIFSINDEGIGIIEDEKKNIFDKFYRSEEAKMISPNGFGLGLFIAKHFIESHNGNFWFFSKGRNKGTAFYFSLPINLKI